MKSLSFALASAGALCLIAGASAHAVTITFDGLASDGSADIANGYQGLNWSNISTISNSYLASQGLPGTGFDIGAGLNAASGANEAFIDYTGGASGSFSSASTFTLNSALFTSAFDASEQVTVTGLLNGNQVFSKTFGTSDLTPTQIAFGWSGINGVTITEADASSPVIFDNVSVSAVPLPAALPLFGAAFAGLAAAARRRNRA